MLRVYYSEIGGCKCYAVKAEDAIVSAWETPNDNLEGLVARLEQLEPGQTFTGLLDPDGEAVTFGVVMMTQDKYESLPEFEGF